MTKYILYAHFNGDDDYSSMRSSRSILETTDPTYRVELDNMSELEYNVNNTITGTVKDSNGNGIACSNMIVQIQRTGVSGTTNKTATAGENGRFSVTFKPTVQGEYNITAIANAENGYLEGRDTITVISGLKDSVLTIRTDNTQYISNQTITIITNLSDSQGNPLANQQVSIYLDDSPTPIATPTTNKNGTVTISQQITEIGEHYFVASYDGNASVKPSSTNINDCRFTILRHTILVTPYETNLYANWKFRCNVYAEDSTPIKQTTFKVVFSGNGTSRTYYLVTNNEGYMETIPLDLGTGEYNVRITGGPWTNYSEVDSTYKILILQPVSLKMPVDSAVNSHSEIPYRVWENLSNITAEDGTYALCGKKCTSAEAIAGKNGSRHTPSPISCNHNITLSSESTLVSCIVGMKCKTVSCSSASAKPKITAPTAKIGSKTKLFTCNTSDNQLPYGDLGWILAEFNVNNISLADFDNTKLEVIFPGNDNSNPGQIQIDNIYTKVEFIPQQAEV